MLNPPVPGHVSMSSVKFGWGTAVDVLGLGESYGTDRHAFAHRRASLP
jgi:hypothetical protein